MTCSPELGESSLAPFKTAAMLSFLQVELQTVPTHSDLLFPEAKLPPGLLTHLAYGKHGAKAKDIERVKVTLPCK